MPSAMNAAKNSLIRYGKNVKPFQDRALQLIPNVISQTEHDALVDELLVSGHDDALLRFRKRRFERDHWDYAIVGYRELERPLELWSDTNRKVLERIQQVITDHVDERNSWLAPHIIDLAKDGAILPHVDSIKFSGHLVCGLSLLSQRTMCLQDPRDDPQEYHKPSEDDSVQMDLAPGSLYILAKEARYGMAHSVFPAENAGRRISVIFRDALQ